jgi:hypothetical protein
MFTFVLLHNTKFNKSWGWYVKVASVSDLFDWFEGWKGLERVGRSVLDFLNSKELEYLKAKKDDDQISFKNHARSPYTSMFIMECYKSAEKGTLVSISSLSQFLSEKIFMEKLKKVFEGHTLYINKVGGYMPFLGEDFEIRSEATLEVFKFPEYTKQDINITRWPNGKHYYAKVGHMDVTVNGESKWNDAETAHKKAEEFLSEL